MEPFTTAPEQSAIRPRPNVTLPVFHYGAHEFVGEAFLGPERFELSVLVVQQAAAIGGYPQRAVPGHGQRADIVIGHGGCVKTRVHYKTDAIESSEAARSTHPQVTIGGLRDGSNTVLGKTLRRPPDPAHISGRFRCGGRS